jgi:hypothetical protein
MLIVTLLLIVAIFCKIQITQIWLWADQTSTLHKRYLFGLKKQDHTDEH